MKLYSTDYVRLVDGKIADKLDIIYHESTLNAMLEDMKEKGKELPPNEKYVKMTELSPEQQKRYIEFLSQE